MDITIRSPRGNWQAAIFTDQAHFGPTVDREAGLWGFSFGILHIELVRFDVERPDNQLAFA